MMTRDEFHAVARQEGWLVPATAKHIQRAEAHIAKHHPDDDKCTVKIEDEAWVSDPLAPGKPIPESEQIAIIRLTATPASLKSWRDQAKRLRARRSKREQAPDD